MTSNRKLNISEELENFRNENGALKRAVDSKSAAIGILRSELEECQRERDEFRMMVETHPPSRPIQSYKTILPCPEKIHSAILSGSENTLAQLLSQSKEENKQLRQELTDSKCRLHDACSDLKILRAEKSRKTDVHQSRLSIATSSQLAQQEREIHIQQMEHLSSTSQAQESDIRCLLEEREELINERDDIRHKLHRLNYILNVLLSREYYSQKNRPQHRTVDLDAIITENRYLQQRMKQLDEEKSIAIANLSKYKSALENCRTNISSRKLRPSDNLIMTPKQVSEFLRQYEGEVGENAEKNLKFISVALIDALNQKSRAVKTQKTANKMLIERVNDLEKRLVCFAEDESNGVSPTNGTNLISASLLDGYNASNANALSEMENVDVANVLKKIQNSLKEEKLLKSGELPCSHLPTESCEDNVDHPTDPSKKSEESAFQEYIDGQAATSSSCNTKAISCSENSSHKSPPSRSISEEIVPLENLDSYISNLKQKRNEKDHSNAKDTVITDEGKPKPEENVPSPKVASAKVFSRDSSDTSFDIDISDYDSDDENLEVTLQNWQSECEKASSNNIIAKLSPKRSVPGLLKPRSKWKKKNVELPDKLIDILK